MPRQNESLARRRLANIYESDRRRALAVANARDRNRRGGDRDDDRAPRRFVVSERRTRQAGFGRGGLQARSGGRRNNNGDRNNQRGGRFEDRSVFRRGNRDRFERDDDIDRRRRRDRRGDRNDNNGGNNRRFAVRRNNDRRRGNNDRRRNDNNRRGNNNNKDRDLDKELDRYKNNGNGNNNNRRGGNDNRRGGKKGPVSKEDLDAQLENFRTALTPVAAPTI